MNADDFIQALTDAIINEQKKCGDAKTIKAINAEQKRIEEAKARRVAEQEQAQKEQTELENAIAEIVDFFVVNKSNLSVIKPVLGKINEFGYDNPKNINNIEHAKEILANIAVITSK